MSELRLEFVTDYKKVTKHRKKCRYCNKLILDGEKVNAEKWYKEKYYPIKGLMGFITWKFSHHAGCTNPIHLSTP